MKQFSCGDVIPGCGETFRADTEDEILDQVTRHAKADHDLAELPPGAADQVRAAIVDV